MPDPIFEVVSSATEAVNTYRCTFNGNDYLRAHFTATGIVVWINCQTKQAVPKDGHDFLEWCFDEEDEPLPTIS